MPRALFAVLPPAAALPHLIRDLQKLGITGHSISTLRPEKAPGDFGVEKAPMPAREMHATGHLRWALQGASSSGATRRLARALAGMGMPEPAARHYQELVRRGNTLLCVFCENNSHAAAAKSLLQRSGARELASTGPAEHSETHRH